MKCDEIGGIEMLAHYFSDQLDTLTDAEKHVLYLLDELPLEELQTMKIMEIARIANVSHPSVIRLCKKLGYNGFSEFKIRILDLLTKEEKNLPLIETKYTHQLQTIADMIMQYKKVTIIGVGLSKPLAEYFSKLLVQIGIPSTYIYESHILDIISNTLNPQEDIVIYLSYSGSTQTLLQIAKTIQFHRIPSVALTSILDTPLHKYSDIHCSFSEINHYQKNYDIVSRSAMFAALEDIVLFLSIR